MRFELAGHRSDSANYEKADLNVWKNQLLEVIDNMVAEPVLLIGMSVGGWLALLGGIERPEKVRGIIGISAAPDFTVGLEEEYMTAAQRAEMAEKGRICFHIQRF